ncbi:MAG: hypothetical protein AB7I48_10195, partial [Planctomycetaceae bacterium]
MDDRDALLARIARLEALVAQQAAKLAEQAETIAAQAGRIKELEAELRRRGKKFTPTPKANARPPAPQPDRRTPPHPAAPQASGTDAARAAAGRRGPRARCHRRRLPRLRRGDASHRPVQRSFRRGHPRAESRSAPLPPHVCRCQTCGATAQGRSDLAAPGAHVGERAKLVTDFYAACHALECRKQRCLVHLLRELVKLREELPAAAVGRH